MNDVNAPAPASAGGLTCLVCGIPDPPPDPTCHHGLDHRVGRAAGCPHCGRLPRACAWRPCFGSLHDAGSGLVRRVWRESGTKWGRLRRERHGVKCPAEAGVPAAEVTGELVVEHAGADLQ
jgi:hypothetical protein